LNARWLAILIIAALMVFTTIVIFDVWRTQPGPDEHTGGEFTLVG